MKVDDLHIKGDCLLNNLKISNFQNNVVEVYPKETPASFSDGYEWKYKVIEVPLTGEHVDVIPNNDGYFYYIDRFTILSLYKDKDTTNFNNGTYTYGHYPAGGGNNFQTEHNNPIFVLDSDSNKRLFYKIEIYFTEINNYEAKTYAIIKYRKIQKQNEQWQSLTT